MDFKKMKAPEKLKVKTIELMENEIKKSKKKLWDFRSFIKPFAKLSLSFLLVFVISKFVYAYLEFGTTEELVNTKFKIIEKNIEKNIEIKDIILEKGENSKNKISKTEINSKKIKTKSKIKIKNKEKENVKVCLDSETKKEKDKNKITQKKEENRTEIDNSKKIRTKKSKSKEEKSKDNILTDENIDIIKKIKNEYSFKKPIKVNFNYYDFKGENIKYYLKVDLGTDIFSILDGVVQEIGENKKDGKYIIINHSGKLISKYSHCGEIKKSKNDRVVAGGIIGKVGKTGSVSNSCLGLELIFINKPVVNFIEIFKK